MASVIVGMGEIGSAFYEILSKTADVYGDDLDPKRKKGVKPLKTQVLHICILFLSPSQFFEAIIDAVTEYKPKEIVIHSSVKPGTTKIVTNANPKMAVAYSPWRGVHSRMQEDMKRYKKYYAYFTKKPRLFEAEMAHAGFNIQMWQDVPTSLELAKLLEVTYYGWLIIWAQHKKTIADEYGADDEKLWEFTDEVHKYLGNRPRMFSGSGIGGHCVMQDKDLLNDSFLDVVFSHDQYYRRNLNGKQK